MHAVHIRRCWSDMLRNQSLFAAYFYFYASLFLSPFTFFAFYLFVLIEKFVAYFVSLCSLIFSPSVLSSHIAPPILERGMDNGKYVSCFICNIMSLGIKQTFIRIVFVLWIYR